MPNSAYPDVVTLSLFVAVCEEGSIARAAAREHIAASALSRRISLLALAALLAVVLSGVFWNRRAGDKSQVVTQSIART